MTLYAPGVRLAVKAAEMVPLAAGWSVAASVPLEEMSRRLPCRAR